MHSRSLSTLGSGLVSTLPPPQLSHVPGKYFSLATPDSLSATAPHTHGSPGPRMIGESLINTDWGYKDDKILSIVDLPAIISWGSASGHVTPP